MTETMLFLSTSNYAECKDDGSDLAMPGRRLEKSTVGKFIPICVITVQDDSKREQ
jgi:hypothetical protein